MYVIASNPHMENTMVEILQTSGKFSDTPVGIDQALYSIGYFPYQ